MGLCVGHQPQIGLAGVEAIGYTDRVVAHKQDGGNIIMVSSITDSRTIKGQFPYAVSKGGMTRMTEVMSLEAAKYNIRVNALAPGYFLTDVSRILLESPMAEEFVKGIPMRRTGNFPDLDGPLLLLASDASRYMTGSVLVVDGGHICASLWPTKHWPTHFGEFVMTELTPFTVSIEDAVIQDLKSRLHATRWPDEETVDDWTQGVPLAYQKQLVAYWADEYDHQRLADRLNVTTTTRLN